jgi:hypothetical protein
VTTAQNFTHIQGVSGSFYGEPICVTIFDCGAAGAGSTSVEVVNRQRNVVTTFEIEEICSNDGVFFGCVETAYVPFNDTNAPDPTTIVSGEFGDELVVRYTSSQPIDEVGHQQYEMSGTFVTFIICESIREITMIVFGLLMLFSCDYVIECS